MLPDYAWAISGGGDKLHNNGGNYAFSDGHAKRITGAPRHNIMEYATTSNTYFMAYLTYDHKKVKGPILER